MFMSLKIFLDVCSYKQDASKCDTKYTNFPYPYFRIQENSFITSDFIKWLNLNWRHWDKLSSNVNYSENYPEIYQEHFRLI